jgi:hypothetical protein
MPGAGSRVADNWLYNVAPNDGTAIGTLVQSSAIEQALRSSALLRACRPHSSLHQSRASGLSLVPRP